MKRATLTPPKTRWWNQCSEKIYQSYCTKASLVKME